MRGGAALEPDRIGHFGAADPIAGRGDMFVQRPSRGFAERADRARRPGRAAWDL